MRLRAKMDDGATSHDENMVSRCLTRLTGGRPLPRLFCLPPWSRGFVSLPPPLSCAAFAAAAANSDFLVKPLFSPWLVPWGGGGSVLGGGADGGAGDCSGNSSGAAVGSASSYAVGCNCQPTTLPLFVPATNLPPTMRAEFLDPDAQDSSSFCVINSAPCFNQFHLFQPIPLLSVTNSAP
jgi:hypothetical protein